MTTTHTTLPEAARRLDLLKQLQEVQQKLVAANQEQAFLLHRVTTLEHALRTHPLQGLAG